MNIRLSLSYKKSPLRPIYRPLISITVFFNFHFIFTFYSPLSSLQAETMIGLIAGVLSLLLCLISAPPGSFFSVRFFCFVLHSDFGDVVTGGGKLVRSWCWRTGTTSSLC